MRHLFICIFFLFVTLCAGPGTGAVVYGRTVFAVQSIDIYPLRAAMQGFREKCTSEVRDEWISGMTKTAVVRKIEHIRPRPDLLLAVGTSSLSKIQSIKNIPIIYMMILNPRSMLTTEGNIFGVSIHVPYDEQIKNFKRILPGMKTIGLVYNPENTEYLEKRAQAAAKKEGITIVSTAVYHKRDCPTKIRELMSDKKVHAFLMLPDITVITKETVNFLLATSFKHQKPILSFSEKYVKMGALAAVTMDPVDIGKQAGEMAEQMILSGGKKQGKRVDARTAGVWINYKIAREFGIDINQESMDGVEGIFLEKPGRKGKRTE